MGLFEWIGEQFNRGPIGNVTARENDEGWYPQSKVLIWLLTVLGLGLFVFMLVAIVQSKDAWLWTFALVVYLVLAYWFSPQPDNSNMGLAGGLIDNPIRISDDANRLLFWFALLLLPGKLILFAGQTIINTIRVFR